MEGGTRLEWLLPAVRHNPRAMRTTYLVSVVTAQLTGAGTESQVYVDIMGDVASSGRMMLRNGNSQAFATGQTDEFSLQCRSLGNIRQLLVGHDNSGKRPAWHPQVIAVIAPSLIPPPKCSNPDAQCTTLLII